MDGRARRSSHRAAATPGGLRPACCWRPSTSPSASIARWSTSGTSRVCDQRARDAERRRWAVDDLRRRADYYNSKPPLNVWLIVASFQAFGVGVVALRLPAVVCAWLTVLATQWWTAARSAIALALLATLVLATTYGFLYVHSGPHRQRRRADDAGGDADRDRRLGGTRMRRGCSVAPGRWPPRRRCSRARRRRAYLRRSSRSTRWLRRRRRRNRARGRGGAGCLRGPGRGLGGRTLARSMGRRSWPDDRIRHRDPAASADRRPRRRGVLLPERPAATSLRVAGRRCWRRCCSPGRGATRLQGWRPPRRRRRHALWLIAAWFRPPAHPVGDRHQDPVVPELVLSAVRGAGRGGREPRAGRAARGRPEVAARVLVVLVVAGLVVAEAQAGLPIVHATRSRSLAAGAAAAPGAADGRAAGAGRDLSLSRRLPGPRRRGDLRPMGRAARRRPSRRPGGDVWRGAPTRPGSYGGRSQRRRRVVPARPLSASAALVPAIPRPPGTGRRAVVELGMPDILHRFQVAAPASRVFAMFADRRL